MAMDERFRFGIEEEYFLADAQTCESPAGETADAFHEAAKEIVEPLSHEFLKGQAEVQTEPQLSFDRACDQLERMRRDLSRVASEHGLILFAAGTHPLARRAQQEANPDPRYDRLVAELGVIAKRAMICAMHIHCEAPEPARRLDVMNRLLPFLPLFYALSVSSPFWQGREAGLKGIRLSTFAEWPRMGLPEIFESDAEYRRFVDLLVAADVVTDASFIWWHIRPSTRFPTVELRICDSCTRVDDAVAIAALYQALSRCVTRRPELNRGVGAVDRGVCASNIWQIQQHGGDARLIDVSRGQATTVGALLEEALKLVEEDARELGSLDWVLRTRDVLARGSSADRQLAVFREQTAEGAGEQEALREVVRMLGRETVGG